MPSNLDSVLEELDTLVSQSSDENVDENAIETFFDSYESDVDIVLEASAREINKEMKKYYNGVTSDAKYIAKTLHSIKKAVQENRKRDALNLAENTIVRVDELYNKFTSLNKLDFKRGSENTLMFIAGIVIPAATFISTIWNIKAMFDVNKWAKAGQKASDKRMEYAYAKDEENFKKWDYVNNVVHNNYKTKENEYKASAKAAKISGTTSMVSSVIGGPLSLYIQNARTALKTTISNLEIIKKNLEELIKELNENGCTEKVKSFASKMKLKQLYI